MAPKKSKGKRPAPSSSYHVERFPNAQGAKLFEEFQTRIVVLERNVDARGLSTKNFFHWLINLRLVKLEGFQSVNLKGLQSEVFEDWVREFYCNMYDVTADSFKSFVRGIVVTITPDLIAKLLKVTRPPNPCYPFPNPENVIMFWDAVSTELTGQPSEWDTDFLYQGELTDDYRLLNIFVNHNIEPGGHTSDLNYSQAYLLYAIGTGLPVDIPKTMFDAMIRIYEGAKRLVLPFGVLICRILIEKGCHAYPYESLIRPKKDISASTLKLSQANTKPHAPHCKAAGAPDVQGESSVLHRLDAVEAAIFDQSIQIENLENRMTEGFNQMRQLANEQYSSLSAQLSSMFEQLHHRRYVLLFIYLFIRISVGSFCRWKLINVKL